MIVGCRNNNGLSKGKVRVHMPQSLLATLAWVPSKHGNNISNAVSFIYSSNIMTCLFTLTIK